MGLPSAAFVGRAAAVSAGCRPAAVCRCTKDETEGWTGNSGVCVAGQWLRLNRSVRPCRFSCRVSSARVNGFGRSRVTMADGAVRCAGTVATSDAAAARAAALTSRSLRKKGAPLSAALEHLEGVDRQHYLHDLGAFNEYLLVLGQCRGFAEAAALYAWATGNSHVTATPPSASAAYPTLRPDLCTLNTLLRVLAGSTAAVARAPTFSTAQRLSYAERLVQAMSEYGWQPDSFSLSALTRIGTQANEPWLALRVLSAMADRMRADPNERCLDTVSYTAVISCVAKSLRPLQNSPVPSAGGKYVAVGAPFDGLALVQALAREMQQLGVPRNVRTFSALVDVCLQVGTRPAEELAFRWFEEMLLSRLAPDELLLSRLMLCAAQVGDATRALELLQFARRRMRVNRGIWTHAIDACVRGGMLDDAYRLCEEMRRVDDASTSTPTLRAAPTTTAAPSGYAYATLLPALARANQMPLVRQLLEEMAARRDASGHPRTARVTATSVGSEALASILYHCGNWRDEPTIRLVRERRDHPRYPLYNTAVMNALMDAYRRCGRPDEAVALYEEMRRCGVPRDTVTYNALLSAYADAGAYRPEVWERLRQDGHSVGWSARRRPDLTSCLALLRAAGTLTQVADAMQRFVDAGIPLWPEASAAPPSSAIAIGGIEAALAHPRLHRLLAHKLGAILTTDEGARRQLRMMSTTTTTTGADVTTDASEGGDGDADIADTSIPDLDVLDRVADLALRHVLLGVDAQVEAYLFTRFAAAVLQRYRHRAARRRVDEASGGDFGTCEVHPQLWRLWQSAPRLTACYNAMIYTVAMTSADIEAALALWQEMRRAGRAASAPDAVTYSALASALLRSEHQHGLGAKTAMSPRTQEQTALLQAITELLPHLDAVTRRKLERKAQRLSRVRPTCRDG